MNKRYWLRGGVVGLLLVIIQIVFMFFSPPRCVGGPCRHLSGLDVFMYNLSIIHFDFFIIFCLGIIFLCILLGWLYGKIKNKNK